MKQLLSINAKAYRLEWWSISLMADFLMQLSGYVGLALISSNESLDKIGGFFLIVLAALFFWISIAVTFRRLRDRGRPLWSAVFYLVPFVGWIWMVIECGFLPSAYTGAKRTLVRKTITAEQPLRPA